MESTKHQSEIISQFTRQAKPFAENSAHSLDRSLSVFRELGQFTGRERVLDSGCGPGLVSCYLAPHVAEVVGVDLTPAMLEVATKAAAALPNVQFQPGNMTALPFPEGSFDTALSRYAFHHLENPAAAFAELVRVTRPGGHLIVVDVTPDATKRGAYDHFERLRDPSHTQAQTFEELSVFGTAHALAQPRHVTFPVPMKAEALIASSFPTQASREQLLEILAADLDRDALSFQVRRDDGALHLSFPITAFVWER